MNKINKLLKLSRNFIEKLYELIYLIKKIMNVFVKLLLNTLMKKMKIFLRLKYCWPREQFE